MWAGACEAWAWLLLRALLLLLALLDDTGTRLRVWLNSGDNGWLGGYHNGGGLWGTTNTTNTTGHAHFLLPINHHGGTPIFIKGAGCMASESPDRECCEPLYPFMPPTTPTKAATPATPPPYTRPKEPPDKYFTATPQFVDVTIEQQEIPTRPRPTRKPTGLSLILLLLRPRPHFRPNIWACHSFFLLLRHGENHTLICVMLGLFRVYWPLLSDQFTYEYL